MSFSRSPASGWTQLFWTTVCQLYNCNRNIAKEIMFYEIYFIKHFLSLYSWYFFIFVLASANPYYSPAFLISSPWNPNSTFFIISRLPWILSSSAWTLRSSAVGNSNYNRSLRMSVDSSRLQLEPPFWDTGRLATLAASSSNSASSSPSSSSTASCLASRTSLILSIKSFFLRNPEWYQYPPPGIHLLIVVI